MARRKKIHMACLNCGEEFSSYDDLTPCPSCGGNGEYTAANYSSSNVKNTESNGWGDDSDHDDDDYNIDNLAYDPNMFD